MKYCTLCCQSLVYNTDSEHVESLEHKVRSANRDIIELPKRK